MFCDGRPVCPACGSDRIEEQNVGFLLYEVTRWTVDADGHPVPDAYGVSEVLYDTLEVCRDYPYICRACNGGITADWRPEFERKVG